jgi:tetratricopeptide (TPR) repeat protein
VEQSLVQLCPEIEGRPRYRLLEVVRQFALDHVRKAGRERPLRDAHLEHFLRLSESAEPNLHGPDRSIWFARLIVDGDNLNRALEHAAAVGDAERGLRLATALWRWWRQRGDFNQGRAQLRRLLALPGASDPVRARALWGASWLALHQLDSASARSLSSELLELATRTADPLARRNALTGLGMAAAHEGRYAESLALVEEALELARVAGDPRILATSVFNRAHALLENGRRADSAREFEDARRRYLKLGDTAFAARMQLNQVLLTMDSDPGRAASLLVDAVSTFRGLDEAWGQVESLEVGVALLAASGRIEAAALAAGAAEAAHQRLGTAQLPADRMLHSRYLEPATATRVWEDSFGAGRDTELDDAVSALLRAIEFAS